MPPIFNSYTALVLYGAATAAYVTGFNKIQAKAYLSTLEAHITLYGGGFLVFLLFYLPCRQKLFSPNISIRKVVPLVLTLVAILGLQATIWSQTRSRSEGLYALHLADWIVPLLGFVLISYQRKSNTSEKTLFQLSALVLLITAVALGLVWHKPHHFVYMYFSQPGITALSYVLPLCLIANIMAIRRAQVQSKCSVGNLAMKLCGLATLALIIISTIEAHLKGWQPLSDKLLRLQLEDWANVLLLSFGAAGQLYIVYYFMISYRLQFYILLFAGQQTATALVMDLANRIAIFHINAVGMVIIGLLFLIYLPLMPRQQQRLDEYDVPLTRHKTFTILA